MKRTLLMAALIAAIAGAKPLVAQQTVVPPSSAASSVGQSINAPVSLQNGTVGVDIPLWVVKSSILSIPISVFYNGSGIRPGQACGLPGMGWTLNAGGVIFRTIRGLPDEDANGWLNKASEIPFSNFDQNLAELKQLANGEIDDMPDLYFISLPGYSGKFVFDKDGIIRVIPYTPIRITRVNASTFEVTTTDGIKYTFGSSASAVLSNTLEVKKFTCSDANTCLYDAGKTRTFTYNSEWYLTRIDSPDNESCIVLSYSKSLDTYESFGDISVITQIVQYKEEDANEEPINPHYEDVVNGQMFSGYNIPYAIGSTIKKTAPAIVPLSIIGRNSRVYFDYINSHHLNKVIVKDMAEQEVKSYTFLRDLDQLVYIKDSKSPYPPIHFEYKGEIPTNTENTDYWGYFNNGYGKNANTYSLNGILTKICYPTGAYQKFIYENHTDGTNTVGGARVKRTESGEFENDTKKTIKEYLYENMRFSAPPIEKYTITYDNALADYIVRGVYKRSYIIYPLGSSEGSHVSYGKVTVLDGSSGINGKTEYFFDNTDDYYGTTYDYPLGQGGNYPFPPMVSMEFRRGLIDSLKVYRKNTNGSFIPVSKEKNTYAADNINAVPVYSLKVGYKRIPTIHATDMKRRTVMIMFSTMLLSEARRYVYDMEGKNPVETRTKYYYNPKNNLPRTIIQLNGLENKATVIHTLFPTDYIGGTAGELASKNIINKPVEVVSYEWDYSAYPLAPATGNTRVLSGKMVAYDEFGREKEIWELETPGTTPLPMVNFRFSNQGTAGLPGGTPQAFSPDLRYYRKKASIDVYDRGLPVQTTGEDNVPSTTVYSYNYTYPVATIANATYDAVKVALGVNISLFTNPQPTDEYLISTMNSLRNSLTGAFITSQTYNHVYGNTTSATDINGLTSYKEYDNLNRLETIKDQDKNIVRHIEYGSNVFRLGVSAVTPNSITLLLNGTDAVTTYTVEYKRYNEIQSVSIPKASTYTLSGLHTNSEYLIRVTAKANGAILTSLCPTIARTSVGTLSVSNTNVGFSNAGGSINVIVTSNQVWTVSIMSGTWFSVSATSGSGNGSFTISCPVNTGAVLSGCIGVLGGNESCRIDITQGCGNCSGACPPGKVFDPDSGKCMWIDEGE